jgi:hypothetical protein
MSSRLSVLPTQELIDRLAERIEQAYALRHPGWKRECSTSRIWSVAAHNLLQAHQEDDAVPLDPELFVASQPITAEFANPWLDVAPPEAVQRYRRRIRQIIRGLRAELRREVAFAERTVKRGQALQLVLLTKNARLSPLGRYIVACRAGRNDLASRFQRQAADQHRSCPLYRPASIAFIAADEYPVLDSASDLGPMRTGRAVSYETSLN